MANRWTRIAAPVALVLAGPLAGVCAPGDPLLPTEPADVSAYSTPAFKACLKAARGTPTIQRCQVAELSRQERLLARALAERLRHTEDDELRQRISARQALMDEQAAAACDAQSHQPGRWGSVRAMGCAIAVTIRRRLALAS